MLFATPSFRRLDVSYDLHRRTGRVANKKDAFEGESRVALLDAKDATQQHGGVTLRFLTA